MLNTAPDTLSRHQKHKHTLDEKAASLFGYELSQKYRRRSTRALNRHTTSAHMCYVCNSNFRFVNAYQQLRTYGNVSMCAFIISRIIGICFPIFAICEKNMYADFSIWCAASVHMVSPCARRSSGDAHTPKAPRVDKSTHSLSFINGLQSTVLYFRISLQFRVLFVSHSLRRAILVRLSKSRPVGASRTLPDHIRLPSHNASEPWSTVCTKCELYSSYAFHYNRLSRFIDSSMHGERSNGNSNLLRISLALSFNKC